MQLENRNSRVSGFRDQDVVTLQKILDAEFELEKESIIKHQREKREQAAKQAGLQRKRMMLERQLREEIFEIEKDHRIEFWLTLVSVRCTFCCDGGDGTQKKAMYGPSYARTYQVPDTYVLIRFLCPDTRLDARGKVISNNIMFVLNARSYSTSIFRTANKFRYSLSAAERTPIYSECSYLVPYIPIIALIFSINKTRSLYVLLGCVFVHG